MEVVQHQEIPIVFGAIVTVMKIVIPMEMEHLDFEVVEMDSVVLKTILNRSNDNRGLAFLARGGSTSGAFRTGQEGNSRGKFSILREMHFSSTFVSSSMLQL